MIEDVGDVVLLDTVLRNVLDVALLVLVKVQMIETFINAPTV